MFRLSCMMKSNKKAMSVPQKKFLCEILIAPLSDINDSLIIILCEPLILFTLHNYMSTIKPLSFIIKLFSQKKKPCICTAFSILTSEFIFHSCQEVASQIIERGGR